MTDKQFSLNELNLLNSKMGLRALLASKKVNPDKALETVLYEQSFMKLQIELIKLQTWVIKHKKKIVIIFEGRDAAGKGGAIRRITQHINPRHFKSIALDIPTEDEKNQWFFQRYVNHLPKPGEIVFFDRSWYNRAVVEPVMGFCTPKEYDVFMQQVNNFEKMITQSDTFLVKFYFSISKDVQAQRFTEIENSPLKHWKITPVDRQAQTLWDQYTAYKEVMLKTTDSEHAPWKIIKANKKSAARMHTIEHILDVIPYQVEEK